MEIFIKKVSLKKIMALDTVLGNQQKPFAEQYAVLELIGAGGQGEVYKVQDKATGHVYAAKKISLATMKDWQELTRLEDEVKALRNLDHPNIPQFQDYCIEKNSWGTDEFIVLTEYIGGKNVSQLLAEGQRFPEEELQSIRTQALEALAAAHAQGIVHRDVKPSNLILAERRNTLDPSFWLPDSKSDILPTGENG